MSIDLFIDVTLVFSIVSLALLTLYVNKIFTAIVLYISMGLLATISWARLNAWDVAIAEAAIGAGLTGALLLVAWKKLNSGYTSTALTTSDLKPDSKDTEVDHVS